MGTEKVRIMLVDALSMVRRGIRVVLETERDMEVVSEAANNDEALRLAERFPLDVVATEVKGADLDGLSLGKALKVRYPQMGLVYLTQYDTPFYFFEALRNGCDGYILKSADPREVALGIRSVAAGHRFIDPAMTRWLVKEFVLRSQGRNHGAREDDLSPRELQVLEMIAQGNSNQHIASGLSLSINTVRHHRARLMEKLGLHSTAQLVLFALQQGLLRV